MNSFPMIDVNTHNSSLKIVFFNETSVPISLSIVPSFFFFFPELINLQSPNVISSHQWLLLFLGTLYIVWNHCFDRLQKKKRSFQLF